MYFVHCRRDKIQCTLNYSSHQLLLIMFTVIGSLLDYALVTRAGFEIWAELRVVCMNEHIGPLEIKHYLIGSGTYERKFNITDTKHNVRKNMN